MTNHLYMDKSFIYGESRGIRIDRRGVHHPEINCNQTWDGNAG